MIAFAGPGYLVAVGYMDPGNWATDLGGGSQFGYTLLSAVLVSSLMAIFLQALSAKLGIATGRDLAQACIKALDFSRANVTRRGMQISVRGSLVVRESTTVAPTRSRS